MFVCFSRHDKSKCAVKTHTVIWSCKRRHWGNKEAQISPRKVTDWWLIENEEQLCEQTSESCPNLTQKTQQWQLVGRCGMTGEVSMQSQIRWTRGREKKVGALVAMQMCANSQSQLLSYCTFLGPNSNNPRIWDLQSVSGITQKTDGLSLHVHFHWNSQHALIFVLTINCKMLLNEN